MGERFARVPFRSQTPRKRFLHRAGSALPKRLHIDVRDRSEFPAGCEADEEKERRARPPVLETGGTPMRRLFLVGQGEPPPAGSGLAAGAARHGEPRSGDSTHSPARTWTTSTFGADLVPVFGERSEVEALSPITPI